jgi:hypothetical protein
MRKIEQENIGIVSFAAMKRQAEIFCGDRMCHQHTFGVLANYGIH